MEKEEFLWCEKYRPKTVKDCILPVELKKTFQQFVDNKNIPNLLLSGKPGTGKTTIAKAMLEELGCDYIIINGSLKGNIDTLRIDINQFASSVSYNGGRKYVILDESDYINPNSTQPALRNFMEEFSKNCGFILTCNFKNRIIEPLHSRCSVVEFTIPNNQKPKLAFQFLKRIKYILDREGIAYKDEIVAEIITKYFPDFRRVINELQRYSSNDTRTIDTGILANQIDSNIKSLVDNLKSKSFTGMRKWVGENSDIDTSYLFRSLYEQASQIIKPASIPQLVIILGDYQYKAAFVADPEINIVACLTMIMAECEFL